MCVGTDFFYTLLQQRKMWIADQRVGKSIASVEVKPGIWEIDLSKQSTEYILNWVCQSCHYQCLGDIWDRQTLGCPTPC